MLKEVPPEKEADRVWQRAERQGNLGLGLLYRVWIEMAVFLHSVSLCLLPDGLPRSE
jgi:hypothetical protein